MTRIRCGVAIWISMATHAGRLGLYAACRKYISMLPTSLAPSVMPKSQLSTSTLLPKMGAWHRATSGPDAVPPMA
jgi:hypothetical protein